jgi:putative tricarboxylic transport membrane protein
VFGQLFTSLAEVAQLKLLVPPGVTITMTIILVLPFTFGLDPLQGLATMTGVYVGGSAGGLVTACLIGIPGTPSAIATTFHGFPMARKGQPGRALWLGTWASFLGGILGALFLVAGTVPLARFALQFGPWEYFSLFIFALSLVAGLTERALLKGLLSGAIGLILTVIGADPIMAVPRLSFGSEFLRGGFQFLPILIGIFAFAQIMTDLEGAGRGPERRALVTPDLSVSHLRVLWEILSRPFLLLWSTLIGLLIGVLPAIGGSAANVMAYDQAKRFSRHPERFATGIPEGIIASELFGVLGYLLVKGGFPLAPLILSVILGVILGDQIEVNLVRALMTDADPWLFVRRPISGAMLALSVLSIAAALWQHRRQYARSQAAEEPDTDF